jgi:hypothetical protein
MAGQLDPRAPGAKRLRSFMTEGISYFKKANKDKSMEIMVRCMKVDDYR